MKEKGNTFMYEGEDDETELDEDLIPGDNDKPGPPQPDNPDAPDNLTAITPNTGGPPSNMPVTASPTTGHETTD